MTAQEQHENIIRICKHETIIKHLNNIIEMAEEAHLYIPVRSSERTDVESALSDALIAIIREAKDTKWGIE